MIGTLLFVVFIALMLAGVPIAVALGIGGIVAIVAANADAPWWGLLAAPQNMHASIAKYPLLALPMFVLVGSIFDRSGVARRMVDFRRGLRRPRARAPCRWWRSWSRWCSAASPAPGPANAAAVGGVMIAAMAKAGYPAPFSASVVGAAAATDILIPPSIAFIVYSVNVPGASVPALFAAGMVPGVLAGLALIVPAVLISRRHGFGEPERDLPRPPFWRSLGARLVGAGRAGADPRRHARGLVHADRSRGRRGRLRPLHRARRSTAASAWRDLYPIFREATEISAVIMLVLALAGIFAYSVNTLGVADPLVAAVKNLGLGSTGTLILLFVVMMVVGMVLDGVSIFLVFLPLLYPLMIAFALGPGVVRRAADDEDRDRPVHAADGGEPDGRRAASRRCASKQTLPLDRLADRLVRRRHPAGRCSFRELALWLPRQLGY